MQNTLELHNELCTSLTARKQQCREQKAALVAKDKEIAQLREQLQKHEGKVFSPLCVALPCRILNFNFSLSTADAAKAKQILDASTEIDAAKAEAEKLREQLALKEDTLRNLQSANKSLEASLAEKENLLNTKKEAVLSVQKELERHIYEDTIVDGDILHKFRMPETFLRGGNFPFEFTHFPLQCCSGVRLPF